MKREDVLKAIKKARELNKKRNFVQTAELIIVLKDLDLRNPQNHIELYVELPHGRGKNVKIAGIMSPEMFKEAEKLFDYVISDSDLEKYKKNKRLGKKLARSFDFFVASVHLMPKVASSIGRYLGPLGKLPSPKAGTIVASKQQLPPLSKKLKRTVKILIKKQPQAQVVVGTEEMKDEELADNVMAVYEHLIHVLPKERHNIKKAYFKFTMSKPVEI